MTFRMEWEAPRSHGGWNRAAQTLHAWRGDSWASPGSEHGGMTQPPPRRAAAAAQGANPAAGRATCPRHTPPLLGRVRTAGPGAPSSAPGRGDALGRQCHEAPPLGRGRRFPGKKRHEVVDTFLPVPIQNYIASGAARKSRAGFNRFLPRMSLQLRRVRHEGFKH